LCIRRFAVVIQPVNSTLALHETNLASSFGTFRRFDEAVD